jgi:heme/copper-type cytochrome/quinol oxidase subunit 2
MDFKALIEFNKYMLALSAASFAYALEKLVPMATDDGRRWVVALLVILFVCVLLGVFIFAAATSAQHPKKAADKESIEKKIAPMGVAHTTLLIVALGILGYLVYPRVMAAPAAPAKVACCCCADAACTPAKP